MSFLGRELVSAASLVGCGTMTSFVCGILRFTSRSHRWRQCFCSCREVVYGSGWWVDRRSIPASKRNNVKEIRAWTQSKIPRCLVRLAVDDNRMIVNLEFAEHTFHFRSKRLFIEFVLRS